MNPRPHIQWTDRSKIIIHFRLQTENMKVCTVATWVNMLIRRTNCRPRHPYLNIDVVPISKWVLVFAKYHACNQKCTVIQYISFFASLHEGVRFYIVKLHLQKFVCKENTKQPSNIRIRSKYLLSKIGFHFQSKWIASLNLICVSVVCKNVDSVTLLSGMLAYCPLTATILYMKSNVTDIKSINVF